MTSFYTALQETIEFSFIVLLLISIYKEHTRLLITSAILVIISGTLLTLINYPLTGFLERTYTGLMFYSFVIILFLSLVSGEQVIFPVICISLALFFPSAQLAAVLISEASMTGISTYLYAIIGISAGTLLFIACLGYLSRLKLRRFFRTDSVMIFIAAFCFLFGGLDKFDSTSIITYLQQGLVNVLVSPRLAMAVTALLLFIPPVFVFIRLLLTPEPVTDSIEVKAEKRKVLAIYIGELIRKGTPLLIALLVSIVMLHAANLAMNPLFDPEPIPVLAEEGQINIPLTDHRGDISDGRIRKYSFRNQGSVYRLIVLMRPDSEVVAALDACEICPPTGYVQRGEHVICKYCSTPIPLQSLGQPGGCNPIPVNFTRKDDNIVLNQDNIIATHNKWLGEGSTHSGH
jgi:uncharacterized membrane protein